MSEIPETKHDESHPEDPSKQSKLGAISGSWQAPQTTVATFPSNHAKTICNTELTSLGFQIIGSDRIKVDLTTPLEQFLIASVIVGVFGVFVSFFNIDIFGFAPRMQLIFFSLISFVSLTLYFSTDNHYIVDLAKKSLLYNFQFLFLRTERFVADFSQVAAVTTSGINKRSREDHWWIYATVIVLENGRIFPVTNYKREAMLECDKKAKGLAHLMGTRFLPAKEHCTVTIKVDNKTRLLKVVQEKPQSYLRLFLILFIGSLIFILFYHFVLV